MNKADKIFETRNLTLRFGGLTAVNAVAIAVNRGEIFSVIGPNGAGKTSVFNAVTGLFPPSAGEVLLDGKEVKLPLSPAAICAIASVAVVTGGLTVLAVNIQSLWDAVVVSNYVYLKPFPWGKAVFSIFPHLYGISYTWTVIPLIVASIIAAQGAYSVWRRARSSPDVVMEAGIARTFQNIRLFQEMTALENVLVGRHSRLSCRFWHGALRLPAHRREEFAAQEKAMECLKIVGLEEHAFTIASNLAYGDQRRLEIARALASEPKVLLLDEPAAGMNPAESNELMELIRRIRDAGTTVVLIEHHMKVVMGISDRIAVLHYGNKIAEGTPLDVRTNPKVIEAYLGKEAHKNG